MTDMQPVPPDFMLQTSGAIFDWLGPLTDRLDALSNPDRVTYRNENARVIGECTAERLLIIAGPGSGKSFLFITRIRQWLPQFPAQQVYVSTFVRKLVEDLRTDVEGLEEADRNRVQVSTLHTLARSIVERNRGTESQRMRRNIRVIEGLWADVVWDDVVAFHPDLERQEFKSLEGQYHRNELEADPEWQALEGTYRRLCGFYNALGFAYMIRLAHEAAVEDPDLVQHQLWIIDEYQDFNPSEDLLIQTVTADAAGLLMAGDDDQALYQKLKASSPEIIVGHYADERFAKAMLPFCGRCSYYVCRAAAAFIAKHRELTSVEKVYLPLSVDPDAPRVRVVATASPTGAVDYVRTFLANAPDLAGYLDRRTTGDESDPFLLILSPTGGLTFGKSSDADVELAELVATYVEVESTPSNDYLRVATYYGAGLNQDDNLAVRKVLHFEPIPFDEVHRMVRDAIDRNLSLIQVALEAHPDVVDRIREVAQIVTTGINDPAGAAEDLAQVLNIQDPERLGVELAEKPIGSDVTSREDEEALETATAGALPPVALMSMTGSKGLSAHHVIILGADDVHMGKTSALTFFVALTRARTSLHIVTSLKTEGSKEQHPFVGDLPADCCEYLTHKKTGHQSTVLNSAKALLGKIAMWRRAQGRSGRR